MSSKCMETDFSAVRTYLASLAKDLPRPIPRPARISSQKYCFVWDFQESSRFQADLKSYLAAYPSKTDKCIMEIIEPRDRQTLSNWKCHSESTSLSIYLNDEGKQKSKWTTHFTLELIGCITHLDYKTRTASAVVAHFCSAQEVESKWTQDVVLRDLLAQIRRAERAYLMEKHDCKVNEQVDHIFHDQSPDLWALLRYSVAKTGIKSLYLFLDNFDFIYQHADSAALDQFCRAMQDFLRDSQKDGVLVKLFITSRSIRTAKCFPESSQIILAQKPKDRRKKGII